MPDDEFWMEPSVKLWVRAVLEDMKPKMESSAFVISLFPSDSEGDVKYWVELGASICMNKPIIIVAIGDQQIPPKLEKIADEIVRCPNGVDLSSSIELREAIGRIAQ